MNVVPDGYAPPELAGSGITVGFRGYDPVTFATQPTGVFYGHPISPTNDHTPFGVGANIYDQFVIQLTFNMPVYLAQAWVDYYANYPDITVSGYTSISDTTPVISTTVKGPAHNEPWRDGQDELKWRDVIALASTPITKVRFYSEGFVQVDDLLLSTVPVPVLFGDFNRNRGVDDGDYTIWADTYGSQVDLRADANGNGIVDDGDYTTWADTYGQGVAPLSLELTPLAVPEPATLGLFMLGGLGLLARRRA
ncbi:MAG: PEP-CTERM sorting domain-containing protein [Phycisphaerales bacterium]|nr:PEP-CTERM sorting domain-containing protein [Phycisphaerales bacterium]